MSWEFYPTTVATVGSHSEEYQTLVLEFQETGYICVPIAARERGLLVALPRKGLPAQLLYEGDLRNPEAAFGPVMIEKCRFTGPFTRSKSYPGFAVAVVVLDIGWEGLSRLSVYKGEYTLEDRILLFQVDGKAVMPYAPDLMDALKTYKRIFSARIVDQSFLTAE